MRRVLLNEAGRGFRAVATSARRSEFCGSESYYLRASSCSPSPRALRPCARSKPWSSVRIRQPSISCRPRSATPRTATGFRYPPHPAQTASSAASRSQRQERARRDELDRLRPFEQHGRTTRPPAGHAANYLMSGSGLFWPDLGASRIANLTPSQGFRPDRQNASDASVYLITMDPARR